MRTTTKNTLAIIGFSVALSSFSLAGHAEPVQPRKASLLDSASTSAKPYGMTLSCLAGTETWSPDRPYIILSLTNSTSHTLFFPYAPGIAPNFVVFSVAYKAATSTQSPDRSWVKLVPNAGLIHTSPSLLVLEDITNRERIVIPAGQEGHLSVPLDFPMSKNGLYRISAVLTVPKASEYNGAVIPSTKIRAFSLVVCSKPLVIRRTATSFVEAPAAPRTAPAH